MITVNVPLGSRSYPIHIGSGALSDAELLTDAANGQRCLLITDQRVAPLYLHGLLRVAKVHQQDVLILPAGEENKTLATLESIYDFLLTRGADRKSRLMALGGGVIGDMVGFAAATYQRGIDFVQLPTTLLAQVDSSVGGKTAVNHPAGKNMIGAFHQPRTVIIDPDTLSSLPQREVTAGLAEVIKYGLIRDPKLFDWLEEQMAEIKSLHPERLAEMIARCCRNKAEVVQADETERGQRAILNLGHTFGHAVETATGYREWLHGEAVGLGIRMAASLSVSLEALSTADQRRIDQLLDQTGLPDRLPPDTDPHSLLKTMYADKKTTSGELVLVTLAGIGRAEINSGIPEQLILDVIRTYL